MQHPKWREFLHFFVSLFDLVVRRAMMRNLSTVDRCICPRPGATDLQISLHIGIYWGAFGFPCSSFKVTHELQGPPGREIGEPRFPKIRFQARRFHAHAPLKVRHDTGLERREHQRQNV